MEKLKRFFLIISWAMYDAANQFFALNIVSLYFVRWITLVKGAPEFVYGITFGLSSICVAVLSPLLGTTADVRGKHRFFLIMFTLLSVIFTMFLSVVNNVLLALIFFAIANIGCQEAGIFYNALMPDISSKYKIGIISGVGKMFGYFGAILALFFTSPLIETQGYQRVFLITGILFLLFALPCLIFIKDRPHNLSNEQIITDKIFDRRKIKVVFERLRITLFTNHDQSGLREFLKAGFFGLCVVQAVMLFMAVYVTKVLGLQEAQVLKLIILGTFFAIFGSIGSGIISDYIGHKKTMLLVFALWIVCLVAGALVIAPFQYVISALAGISLGATWVVSRALVISMVPREQAGEAFGLFSLIGYLSGIVGPAVWGILIILMRPFGVMGTRMVLLCFIPFMIIGCLFLMRIPEINSKLPEV
ncbi:MAG: MFS transporter [Candidatus Omnitrophica bacterium]|nr:MFS transporter [Candidatus Omnitrophota bacterium]